VKLSEELLAISLRLSEMIEQVGNTSDAAELDGDLRVASRSIAVATGHALLFEARRAKAVSP